MQRWADRATIAGLASAVLLCAALSGTDASFDLRNYHLYNGYAFLHGRLGVDLAPAQLQTFYVPTLDAAYFVLFRSLNAVPSLLNVVLAIPHAIAVCLAWAVARLYLPRAPALLATLIGATGAALLPTLATTMSEAPLAALELGALLLALRHPDRGAVPGMLAGVAVGMKLTAAPYALALMIASGTKRLLRTGAGIMLGACVTAGYWWLILWRRYDNPLFPYFNDLFRSPWVPAERIADLRFMPRDVLQALVYPAFWAVRPVTLVAEFPIRDPRIALGLAAALILGGRAIRARQLCPLAVFFLTALALWEAQFSILRYLAALELLSGTLIVLAFGRLSPVIAVATLALTVYPHWGRTAGPTALDVRFPPLPSNTLGVMLDPGPMSYVIPFAPPGAPPGIRFVGANSILVHPAQATRLAQQIETTIRTWPGPLWGLEMPEAAPGVADATLNFYGLHRANGCRHIPSNLDDSAILACPLIRAP